MVAPPHERRRVGKKSRAAISRPKSSLRCKHAVRRKIHTSTDASSVPGKQTTSVKKRETLNPKPFKKRALEILSTGRPEPWTFGESPGLKGKGSNVGALMIRVGFGCRV